MPSSKKQGQEELLDKMDIEFNTSIKDTIDQLDAEFKSYKCRICDGQMYFIASDCADSINDNIDRTEFLKHAAISYSKNSEYSPKHCWDLAIKLWDARPLDIG